MINLVHLRMAKGTAEAHGDDTDVSSPPVIEFSSLLVDDGTAEDASCE